MERLVDLLRESESLGATAAVLRARLKCVQSRLKCAEHDLFGGSYPLHAAVQRKDTGKCIKISFLACAQSPAPRARALSLSRARTLCPSLGSALPSSIPHLILPCILIRTTDRAKYNDLLQLYPGAADDVNEDGKTPLALALSLNAADSVLYVAHT